MLRPSRRVMLGTLVALWVSQAGPLVAAPRPDETTLLVQAALAKRGFYFETPDGKPGPSTADALRRFQIREGLAVSGKLDDATARALNLAAGAPKPSAAPPRPVNPSASAAADRDFLRQNGLTTTPLPSPAPTPRRAPTPLPPAPGTARPKPAAAEADVFTNVPRGRAPTSTSSPAAPAITPAEAAGFLRRYLAAGAADDPRPEVSLFAPEVDYFNNGRVSRRFVERDQVAYRRRWPFRRYQLENEPELTRVLPGGGAEIRYHLRYEVESPARVAAGRTVGELHIRRVPGGGREAFEIVSIKERPL